MFTGASLNCSSRNESAATGITQMWHIMWHFIFYVKMWRYSVLQKKLPAFCRTRRHHLAELTDLLFFCFVLFFKFFIVLYEHNNFCNTIQVFNTTCATMLYFNVFFLCYCWSTQLCCSKLSENLRNLTGGQEIEKISKKKHIKLAAVQDI